MRALNKLTNILSKLPTLSNYNGKDNFTIQCDASHYIQHKVLNFSFQKNIVEINRSYFLVVMDYYFLWLVFKYIIL